VLTWQAIADRDYLRAIDHSRLLIARYPADVEARLQLGRLLLGEERLPEALEALQEALVIDPESPELHNAIGGVASYLGQHGEAIAHHQRYVALLPGEANAYDSLGLSYHWAGDYQRALDAFDQASTLDPKFEVVAVHRANTFWAQGRNREAIRELQRYLELATAPSDRHRGLTELFLIYRNLGDAAQADVVVRQLEGLRRPNRVVEILHALDRGDRAAATRFLQQVPNPDSGRGSRGALRIHYDLMAQVAMATGDNANAIRYASEALRHIPMVYMAEDYLDTLADTYVAAARDQDAIEEYRRILTLNANRARTRYKLARALQSSGRGAEAKAEYQRFLDSWKTADADAPEVLDAKTQLRRR
jgi:tetratricopeptide (TPR) repeat protein